MSGNPDADMSASIHRTSLPLFLVAAWLMVSVPGGIGAQSEYLSDLPELIISSSQDWGILGLDVAAHVTDQQGVALRIGQKSYSKGLGHHANGTITVGTMFAAVANTATGQTRLVKTYGPGPMNADPYYRENLVLGDLPAGLYRISFTYDGKPQQEWVYTYAGQVTYVTFQGAKGFKVGLPPAPALKSLPSQTPSPIP